MKKLFIISVIICMCLSPAGIASAGPDFYPGDLSIYGGSGGNSQPNVLIILDTSLSMQEPANSNKYLGHEFDYAKNDDGTPNNGCGNAPCLKDHVYKCAAWGNECGNWVDTIPNVNMVTTSCGGTNPRSSLLNTGMWNSGSKKLSNAGVCGTGSGIYATGNFINWQKKPSADTSPKIDIAKRVLKNLISSTSGIKFGLMVFNGNNGSKIFSSAVGAGTYRATIKDMDATYFGTTTNRAALLSSIDSIVADSWTPLSESLYEAMLYFKGAASEFNKPLVYTTPITSACQSNFVVIISDGMSTSDQSTPMANICPAVGTYVVGDCDKDGKDPANDDGTKDPPDTPEGSPWYGKTAKNYENQGSDYLDDVAYYMYRNDMVPAFTPSNVTTYTVGFGLGSSNKGAVKLLNETAANGAAPVGKDGDKPIARQAFLAEDEDELAKALMTILGTLMDVNTSFVAPAVPVSPENKLYSGSRIYMGFFKPQPGSQWIGNLKKYALDLDKNIIVDANNEPATETTTGAFKPGAMSFWSMKPDGGEVNQGGVGERLNARDLAANPRKIYTYKGSSSYLTDPSNAFIKSNVTRTDVALGSDAAKDKLVNYVLGFDAYDVNKDLITDVNRGSISEQWLMGDILHSKPAVVYYNQYSMNQETDCSINNSLIFVGANDGRLYAFRDCDGEEEWSFIPPDLLPRLKYLTGTKHINYVDGSPVVYRYDENKDGIVNGADRMLLMFGERRGGGKDGVVPDAGTGGSYYLLDITSRTEPRLLWRISNTIPDTVTYKQLGESYSEPKFVKIKNGTANKLVAIVGGGYDNLNEDGRYGASQTFTGTGIVNTADLGLAVPNLGLTGTSAGLLGPLKPIGNAIRGADL